MLFSLRKIEKKMIKELKTLLRNYFSAKFFKEANNPIFIQSKYDKRKKPINRKQVINISSITNYGIDKLLKLVFNKLAKNHILENSYISRERHYRCLINTKKYLENLNNEEKYDIIAENIRLALIETSKIYGSVDIEKIFK